MSGSSSFLSFYDPDFYDQEIGPGSRVPELYVSLAVEMGGPILELGCGTGNILLPIAQKGVEAWGLDASAPMLERAREKVKKIHHAKRLELALGYMEEFSLDCKFRQIFLTNDVIAHLIHGDALLQAFSKCREHMAPNGRLTLDMASFDIRYLAQYSHNSNSHFRHRGIFPLKKDGEQIQVWERTTYDVATGVLTAHFRYERLRSDGQLLNTQDRTLVLRPRNVDEVRFALLAAGFEEVEIAPAGVHDGSILTASTHHADTHPN